jgi:polygalacturonase
MPSNNKSLALRGAHASTAVHSARHSAARPMSRRQKRRANQPLNQPGGRSRANRQQQVESEELPLEVRDDGAPASGDTHQPDVTTAVVSQQLPSEDAWARKMHAIASDE